MSVHPHLFQGSFQPHNSGFHRLPGNPQTSGSLRHTVAQVSGGKIILMMDCRIGCGACCIALSISSPIPGMPNGKPSGVRCIQLTDENRCKLFGLPVRPEVCIRLRPMPEMCGTNAEEALAYLYELERVTIP